MSTAALSEPPLTSWTIDPAHTHAEFAVRHMMISTVKGRFSDLRGTVVLDENNLADSYIDIAIGVASVDTRMEQRDAHLRSADFFDAENHPIISFKSTRVEGKLDGALQITGNLTIRGVTREVTLDVESEGRVRDPYGLDRAGFTARTKINRTDFGLTWNAALETGGVVVGDEVKISLDVEMTKPPA